jgi:hypothetical protein
MRKGRAKELQGSRSKGAKTLRYLVMKPRPSPHAAQARPSEVFKLELPGLVNPNKALVVLAHEVTWPGFEAALGASL